MYNKSNLERTIHTNFKCFVIQIYHIAKSRTVYSVTRKTLNHGNIYNMKYRFSTDNSVANVTDISPSMF